ncbi:Ribosomal lysine N-methyltransferase 4 [Sphaceloma murrayae]|uniref:Ribosomal lysine N-methyltransferase 4 n=1 Tax=Sphaceloma murrayae TaxID=2082308 RepID=A0A2K1QNH3_9PEZI|nr:Ribosomal lysine N-methyltransferase 4 [Sphaceloma murrayae]
MGTHTSADALIAWLRENNGFLNPSTVLLSDGDHGGHMVATSDIADDAVIMNVPHSIALSCLNAMVDDSLPVLKAHAESFTVEALGVLYLMSQWLDKENSFWKPYLDILPTPEKGFNTPFWFDEEDLQWLKGTDLLNTFEALESAWRTYWRDDTKILNDGGMDRTLIGLHRRLCKWAATVYNSRSLSSRAVRPQDSKYWTAYKHGPKGRQTVLLDFSKVSETRKDFPVLVPIMDCLNHNPEAKVDWAFEPGRFVLSVSKGIGKGEEVYNNYGPKSNSELLMGYGFCIENNPYDCVFETLKPPPRELHRLLRSIHPGYFTTMGAWNSEAATFRLTTWSPHSGKTAWASIPESLIELFYYMVIFERGLEVRPIETDPQDFLTNGHGRRVLPRVAFYIVSSLMPKITKLTESGKVLLQQPQNEKQRYAKMYRDGQLAIMHALRDGLLTYNRSLRPPGSIEEPSNVQKLEIKPYIVTLEEALCIFAAQYPKQHQAFVSGIMNGYSITELSDLWGSEVEQHVWVLLVCAALITCSGTNGETEIQGLVEGRSLLLSQVRSLVNEYDGEQYIQPAPASHMDIDGADEEAASFFRIVMKARSAGSGGDENLNNLWLSRLWTSDLILDWGLRIARSQGMNMRMANGEVRYVLYLHVDD